MFLTYLLFREREKEVRELYNTEEADEGDDHDDIDVNVGDFVVVSGLTVKARGEVAVLCVIGNAGLTGGSFMAER